jgi:hypothetical protein
MNSDLTTNQLILINLILLFLLKVLLLLLGFLTIRIGSKLVREGVKGEFKFNTEAEGYKAALESGSPGLLFVLLGSILLGYGIYVKKDIPHKTKTKTTQQKNESNASDSSKNDIGPFDNQ